jgi:septum formation protein
MDIVLGSSSPRRKQILDSLLPDYRISHPAVDETTRRGEDPGEYAARISLLKNEAITASWRVGDSELLAITADTIVTIDSDILGKPADHEDAVMMLQRLSGREHRVITSITLAHLAPGRARVRTDSDTTQVRFKNLAPCDITDYLASISYLDKAGAYAYQDQGRKIIEQVSGSVTNVIGFPLRLFFSMLKGSVLCRFLSARSGLAGH